MSLLNLIIKALLIDRCIKQGIVTATYDILDIYVIEYRSSVLSFYLIVYFLSLLLSLTAEGWAWTVAFLG